MASRKELADAQIKAERAQRAAERRALAENEAAHTLLDHCFRMVDQYNCRGSVEDPTPLADRISFLLRYVRQA